MSQKYELDRLSECFSRLELLQNEISTIAVKVDATECDNEQLVKAAVYCQLASELRDIVLRYRPELDGPDLETRIAACVNLACAAIRKVN